MQTVVCFGDSITRGQISANYIRILSNKPTLRDYRFINAGVNSDLTLNLLRRVSFVAALRPDIVTILIGTNDAIATVRPFSAIYFTIFKGMYYQPDLEYSSANLTRIIRHLKEHTGARVALASIPPLGEVLDSRPMELIRTYNTRWMQIAQREDVDFLPLFERQASYLASLGQAARRAYNGSTFLTMEFIARALLTAETFERFSQRKGFNMLTDGVHMNHVGSALIAEVIENYLLNQ
jgi:lysophospholipase L1-like esterase